MVESRMLVSDSYAQNILSIGMEAKDWPPEDGSDNHAASGVHSAHFFPACDSPSLGSQWSEDVVQGDLLTSHQLH